jgi:hypothetical protein
VSQLLRPVAIAMKRNQAVRLASMSYPDDEMLDFGRRAIAASVKYPFWPLPYSECLATYLSDDDGHDSLAMRASPEGKWSSTYASAP